MNPKGYEIYTKIERFAVCDFCGAIIKDDLGKLEGFAIHHVSLCRYNPANGHCETCVNAQSRGFLDVQCKVLSKIMFRGDAPYPCDHHKARKPDGAA